MHTAQNNIPSFTQESFNQQKSRFANDRNKNDNATNEIYRSAGVRSTNIIKGPKNQNNGSPFNWFHVI